MVTGARGHGAGRCQLNMEQLFVQAEAIDCLPGGGDTVSVRERGIMGCVADRVGGLGRRVEELNVRSPEGVSVSFRDVSAPVSVISPRGAKATHYGTNDYC